MNGLKRHTLDSKGFTLVELLVTVAMASLVLLLVGQMFISTNKINAIQEEVASMQQNVRAVMEIMNRDIMMAGLNPTSSTTIDAGFADEGTDQSDTDANSVTVKYDYDGDGTSEVDRSYYFDSTNETIMFRDGTNAAVAFTEKGTIASMVFNYTLSTGSTDSTPDTNGTLGQIKVVSVTICGKITGAFKNEHSGTYCFTSNIKPRNM